MRLRLRKSRSDADRAVMRSPAMRTAMLVFTVFLGLQTMFWHNTRDIRPEMEVVPDVPGERTVRALSFGDEEAFFRLYALSLQNAGDTFGRFTALYKYDFHKLSAWFHLLDTLNNQSNYLPALGSYYYSQSQNPSDVVYIVDYLDNYTRGREKEKWWWVVQASYLAQHKLGDLDRALAIASRLVGIRGIPIWAQQLPAFIHEARGEFGDALTIIDGVLKHPEDFSEGELNFMRYFVDERIGRLDAVKKELDEIKKFKEEQKAKGVPDVKPMGPPPDVGAISASGE